MKLKLLTIFAMLIIGTANVVAQNRPPPIIVPAPAPPIAVAPSPPPPVQAPNEPGVPNTSTPGIIGTGATPSGLPGDSIAHPGFPAIGDARRDGNAAPNVRVPHSRSDRYARPPPHHQPRNANAPDTTIGPDAKDKAVDRKIDNICRGC